MRSPDVVVIGGGIIGCACAYYLARAGVSVRLLERGPLGCGASRAGMSHVVTWEEPETHLSLARASQRLYEELAHELPADIEYRRTGSIAVVEQESALQGLNEMVSRLQAWGIDCQILGYEDLREIEPGLSPSLPGGAYFPGDGMVNPLNATRALAVAAARHGAVIRTFSEVTGIERRDGAVTAVTAGGERIPCGSVVIAAGAWSASAAKLAGVEIPIQPRKGTLVVTAPVPPDFMKCKVILSASYMDSVHGSTSGVAVAANIQQVKNGNLLLGSTRQMAGFDTIVQPEVALEVLRTCLRIYPRLSKTAVLRMWAGLRPYTPDLLPVIGEVPGTAGLYIAAGHEGIGITEAPVTGLLISQLVTGQPTVVDTSRVNPGRFSGSQ